MKRRQFIQQSSLILGGGLISLESVFANADDPLYKIKEVRGGVKVFSERGGTIAFYSARREHVVVDAQFPDQSKHLIDEIRKTSQKPFGLLINTHHHGDHTAGNISFKGLVKNVVAHQNSLTNQKTAAQRSNNDDKQLYPDLTYADTWKKRVGREKIALHYFGAAHTNGDSVVHFENANVAHLGDLVFNRRYPFVDRLGGANIRNWIEVLGKIVNHFDNDTQFIFGHAFDPEKIIGNKADISAFQDFLSKLLALVDQQIKAGKSKEDILKITEIPNTEWKGDGIQRGLTAAFEELSGL